MRFSGNIKQNGGNANIKDSRNKKGKDSKIYNK
jgi:hypothetical protein